MRLPEFLLERYFARHEFTAPRLLCCSDCETWTITELLALEPDAAEGFLNLRLGYTEAAGGLELRRAVASLYQDIRPDQVLIFSGAEEAIFILMNVALESGDQAVVHWPCYQSLFEVAAGLGCRTVKWAAREETGWQLRLDDLEALLRPETRLVIINSPHNPTGALIPGRVLVELNRLSRERGFVVFSDEVYRCLEYEPGSRPPAFCDLNETAVSLGVMSKSFGLAGLRLGWIATRNRELLDRMAAFKDYTTICASGPGEYLAALALRHRERLIDRNREIIRINLERLEAFFGRRRDVFNWQPPQAGPIAFPSLKEGDAGRFCREAIEGAGVLLLPGEVYGPEYAGNFRIGFGRKDMPASLARLEEYLERRIPAAPGRGA
ncbi:MAG: aminotransferase class I/II-fold pyridoxal phosphate-dependent enzyme [Thermodesulfobacteriota bacterium]